MGNREGRLVLERLPYHCPRNAHELQREEQQITNTRERADFCAKIAPKWIGALVQRNPCS